MGYITKSKFYENNTTSLNMYRQVNLWGVLFNRLPKKIVWKIWQKEDNSFVYCHPQLGFKYKIILIALNFLFASTFIMGSNLFIADGLVQSTTDLYIDSSLLLFSVILLFYNFRIIQGGGQDRLNMIINGLRVQAVKSNTFFVESGSRVAKGHLLRIILFLLNIFIVCASTLIFNPNVITNFFELPLEITIFITLMLILIIILTLTILPMTASKTGYGLRLTPALGGITTPIFLLLLFSLQFPFNIPSDKFSIDNIEIAERMRLYSSKTFNESPLANQESLNYSKEEILTRYNNLIFASRASLICVFFFLSIGLFFLYNAIIVSLKSLYYLDQVYTHPEIPWSKEAMEPSIYMTRMRLSFVIVWAIFTYSLMWATSNLFNATIAWISDGFTIQFNSPLDMIDISIFMTGTAFNIDYYDIYLQTIIRLVWLSYLIVCWTIFILPMGYFFIQDRQIKKILNKKKTDFQFYSNHIITLIKGNTAINFLTFQIPQIIILEDYIPYARSMRIGLFKKRKIIIVSSVCKEILNSSELDALLAHELSHHILKQTQLDYILRFIGRATFFGDAFIRLLQDSFKYEIQADNYSINHFKIRAEDLKSCLMKIHNAVSLTALKTVINYNKEGINIVKGETSITNILKNLNNLSRYQRLKIAMHLYKQQYTGTMYSGYWHPSIKDRLKYLTNEINSVKD